MGNRFSGYFFKFSFRSLDQLKNGLAIALDLGRAHPADAQQLGLVVGPRLGDRLQRLVGEDDIGGHPVVTRPLLAPLPQSLEECLVIGRRAVTAPAPLALGGTAQPLPPGTTPPRQLRSASLRERG